MSLAQLKQIKIFKVGNYETEDLEKAVNAYVIEIYSIEGSYPSIETNENYVSVICNRLVETTRK